MPYALGHGSGSTPPGFRARLPPESFAAGGWRALCTPLPRLARAARPPHVTASIAALIAVLFSSPPGPYGLPPPIPLNLLRHLSFAVSLCF